MSDYKPKYARAYALFLEGKSDAQIGKAIGSSKNSVAGLLCYARSKLDHPQTEPRVKHKPGSDAWWAQRGY